MTQGATTDIEASDDEVPSSWTNLSDILKEVSLYVRTVNSSWFYEHQQLFKMQTDDLFSMEYSEVDFAERLYNSIGFLGRNFRYRDSDDFMNLKYFIQRYISDATLQLELKFLHSALRFHYELNKNLGQKKLAKLKKNIVLLNKVGKLLTLNSEVVSWRANKL
jgi:hypothetical protein